MPKSIDEWFKDWWRTTGREEDNSYCGRAATAESAYRAGAEQIIDRIRDGDETKTDKG